MAPSALIETEANIGDTVFRAAIAQGMAPGVARHAGYEGMRAYIECGNAEVSAECALRVAWRLRQITKNRW